MRRDVTRSRVAVAAAVAISVKSVGQQSTAMTTRFFCICVPKRREVEN